MKPIKLKVKTKTENYPVIIGSNLINSLNSYLNKNSIIFNQCLLVIDNNVPNKMISKVTGAKYSVATINGTSALHAALLVAGANNETEIITQPLTFVATANAISYTGSKPIFIDVDKDTMGMSPRKLRKFLENNSKIITDINNIPYEKEKLRIHIKDYYYSNVIARASKTMFECKSSKNSLKSTGTEG